MYGRLYGLCTKRAVWIISHSVVPKLINMVDAGNHLIWTPSPVYGGAVSGAIPTQLLGLPVVISEKMPAITEENCVVLCDLSNYAVGIANNAISIEKSNAPRCYEGEISYRTILRFDGNGLWPSPITPVNNDTTVSWIVGLGA